MFKIPPYKKRKVQYINQAKHNGWRIKVYGISASDNSLTNGLVNNVVDSLLTKLPKMAITEHCYGVGFLIIHQGTMRNWFLLDWWETEDIMHQLLFSSLLETPHIITAESDTSLIACVHELRVINFESNAWICSMLNENKESNLDEYLKICMND